MYILETPRTSLSSKRVRYSGMMLGSTGMGLLLGLACTGLVLGLAGRSGLVVLIT